MGCNVSKEGKEKKERAKSAKEKNGNAAAINHSENVDNDMANEITGDGITGLKQVIATAAEEEEVDPDLSTTQEEEAATKIQAAFRGSQVRKNINKNMQKNVEDSSPIEDIDPNDPSANQAAAKIQASFRGHKVRKELNQKKQDAPKEIPESKPSEEEEIDIDLTDPDVQKAATKIQASFRGHMVRKTKSSNPEEENA